MQKETNAGDRGRANTTPLTRLRRIYISAALAIAGLTFCLTSQANTVNLVMNAGFESTKGSTVFGNLCTPGLLAVHPVCPEASPVADWEGHGLLAVFEPQTGTTSGTSADNSGANWKLFASGTPTSIAGSGPIRYWGPGTNRGNCESLSSSNGCPNSTLMPMNGLKLSPVGGNFIGLDGDHVTTGGINYQGSISQTLNNLHKGLDYDVSFYWATAQQVAYNGATMEQLRVSLCGPGGNPGTSAPFGPGNSHAGSCGFFTDIVSTPNHGFKGWFHEAPVQFKATASKETLEFLALGTPNALPPYALLDGVDVTPVPEPATWSLFGIGFAVIAGLAYRRHKSVSVD